LGAVTRRNPKTIDNVCGFALQELET